MHAGEHIDIYISLSISVTTGGKHGKCQGKSQPDFTQFSEGLGFKRGNDT